MVVPAEQTDGWPKCQCETLVDDDDRVVVVLDGIVVDVVGTLVVMVGPAVVGGPMTAGAPGGGTACDGTVPAVETTAGVAGVAGVGMAWDGTGTSGPWARPKPARSA